MGNLKAEIASSCTNQPRFDAISAHTKPRKSRILPSAFYRRERICCEPEIAAANRCSSEVKCQPIPAELDRAGGLVLSRDQLLNDVWRNDPAVTTRTIDVHIAWLRQKLVQNPRYPEFILNIQGLGYKFVG